MYHVRLKFIDACSDHSPEVIVNQVLHLSYDDPVEVELIPEPYYQLLSNERPHRLVIELKRLDHIS